VYRWQDAAGEEAGEWLRVRLRRVSGQGLSNAIVDPVEGRCGGVAIAMPCSASARQKNPLPARTGRGRRGLAMSLDQNL